MFQPNHEIHGPWRELEQSTLVPRFYSQSLQPGRQKEARCLLKCNWFNVKRMIKHFIERQLGEDVKSMQSFKMSVKE